MIEFVFTGAWDSDEGGGNDVVWFCSVELLVCESCSFDDGDGDGDDGGGGNGGDNDADGNEDGVDILS